MIINIKSEIKFEWQRERSQGRWCPNNPTCLLSILTAQLTLSAGIAWSYMMR